MAYTTTTKEWFSTTAKALVDGASGDMPGPVLFDIGGVDGGAWLVDFANKSVSAVDAARPGATPKVIVRAAERDFMALVEGRMSADDGIVTKRLQLAGDVASISRRVSALTQKH
jgi:putative sterol carrier protein